MRIAITGSTGRVGSAIVDMALADPTAAGNPIPLTRALAASMLAAAFEGRSD